MVWIPLTDYAKQLILHCKLRERNDDSTNIYEVIEIEFDQYKLKQLSKNNVSLQEAVEIIVTSEQIMSFKFDIQCPG